MNTQEHLAAKRLALNEVGYCNLSLDEAVAFAPYARERELGAFILIDRQTNATVGAGTLDFALRRAGNVHWQHLDVDSAARARIKGQTPKVLWFTGLSGAGKSTVANLVDRRLHALGYHTFILDGDNVRHGLNRDLGFTDEDRVENIRRVAEVARLMADAGLIVLVSFISPFRAERRMARERFGEGEFVEVFVDVPLAVAEARDVKGLYAKARAGQIPNFTGIDSPYEAPETPRCTCRPTATTPRPWPGRCWHTSAWSAEGRDSAGRSRPTRVFGQWLRSESFVNRCHRLSLELGCPHRIHPRDAFRFRVSVAAASLSCLVLCVTGCDRSAPGAGATAPIPVTVQTVATQSWNSTVQSIATVRARESGALTAAVSDVVENVYFDSGDSVQDGPAAADPARQLAAGGPERGPGNLRGGRPALSPAAGTDRPAAGGQVHRRYPARIAQCGTGAGAADAVGHRRPSGARAVRRRAGIRQISPGTLVTSDTVIATLDDIDRMHVDFQVPEAQLALVHVGDKVSGSAAAFPGERFEGEVATIDSRVDETTRAVTVRADFANADHRLRPGMLLDVRLFQPARQALVIPEIAVVQVGRESFVYRVKSDQSVERADVRTGERRDGKVEILEGLKAGERIVVDGTGKLRQA